MQTRHCPAARFRPVSFLGLFCALGLGWFVLPTSEVRAQQEPPAKTSLPVLTRAEQIRNLTPDQAGLGYPVRLRAVITYCDLSQSDLFVEDATGSIYVDPSELKAVLHSGQYVEVEGTSDAGDFSSEVTKPRITILGEAPIPRPQKITAEELVSGNHDTRWVEVEGVARSVIDDEGRLRLNLASGAARFDAYVLDHPSAPPALVGAKIRLRGVSSGVYTVSNEYIGAALMVPSLTDLHVLGHGPADLFSLPVRPIHFLLRSHPEGAFNRPVRLQGVVTLQQLGQVLYVHDGKNAVQVNTRQMTPLGIGDLIDVVGFPALGEYTPILEEAIFRRIGAGRVPPPVTTTASQLLLGAQNGELVRISGRLIGHAIQSGQVSLELVEGEFTFKAGIEDPKGRVALASLRDGSYVQLTGICSVEADYTRRPHSFSILLRSPEDIVVLRSPSWWTLKRMLWAVGVMAGLILAALAWAVLLRRRVDEQTATIHEQLRREGALKERYYELFENANDIVFTCGLRGHLTSLNRAGQRITGYSLPEAVGKNLTQMVAPEYSALAQQMIQRDGAQEGPAIHELEIVTKDGRRVLLEVSIRFICDEGLPVAIQGIARDITERKRAEEALERLRRQNELILNSAGDGILGLDSKGRHVFVNPAAARMLGHEVAELLGRPSHAIWHHSRKDGTPFPVGECPILASFRDGVACGELDGTFYRKDGTRLPVEYTSNPISDGEKIVGTVLVFRDITERKRAEEALQESEARLKVIFNSVQTGILVIDAETCRIVEANPVALKLIGVPRDAVVGATCHKFVCPADEGRCPVLDLGQSVDNSERVLLTATGEQRAIIKTVMPVVISGRKHLLESFVDITERKRAEEALRESEERFRGLFQGAAEGILVSNFETQKFVYANPAVCRMLGYTEEELVHMGVSDLHPQQDLEWVVAGFMAQTRGEKTLASAIPCLCKDGTTIYADVNASRLVLDGKDCCVAFFTDITARKRAEEALRRSEERSRIVAASISDLIYEWDLKDKIDWYGDVDSLMGYPAGGFPRTLNGWAAALHPEDKERVWVAVEDQLKGVAPYDVEEYRIAEKDGGWRWWSARGTVLRDEQGQPRGWIGAVTDITERKRAEETLRESEERFRGLFQSAAEGILVANIETKKFVHANPAVCRMLGYTEEELVHMGVSDIHPQQDLEWVVADFMAQARGEKTLAPAIPCLCKDGTTIYADVNASGLMVDGKDCSVGFFTDITERRRAEQTQVRLVAILDATPDFVGFADARDGHIFYINPAGRKMVGVGAQEDVTRLKMADVHPEWTNKLFRDEIIPTAIRDGVWTGECAFLHRDGREIPVLMVLLAHKSPSGEVERFSTISRDITERKRAEAEVQKAKEAADAASRAKSEFLANMSHEIRTPMNGIIGMTELALDTELTPEQREYLVMVKDSADILLTLINDILDFSKIEAGKLGLDLVEFNLHDTLGNTMKTLAPRASGKGLELVYQTPPRLPRDLLGDPGRLRQILVNLVGNAIKFTAQGEVVVHVETQSQTEDGVELHFAVTDTGIGIPREKQELIFAAFAQADASTTRKYGGTGLGLAIASQLVKMMRGRLWVDSEPGQGSTFHFTAHFGLARAPTKPHALRETVCLRDMPVLVVDDNATNRRILEAMLTHWLMQPTLADGGWAGLAAMEQAKDAERPFPLVLIDAQMPDMDGFTLARRIKESPGLAGATIMMLASAGQRGDAARCRELGIAAYLIKPIRQSELLEAILVALGRPSREGERPTVLTRHSLREARRKLRVLVAEDNVVNRELAVRLLEKQGHTVAVAGNGRETLEALEKATSRGFDVVLMDVQMPEMDGLEATAAIRQKEKATGRHLPIIAMTAHALKGDRERCLAAGMDDYLAKPIQAKELLAAVEGAVLPAVETRESVPAEPRPEEILDRVTALARVDGDAKLLGELARLFLADTARLLSAVRQAVTRGDAKALEYAAHALKSSVGNFSAHAAFEAAARLEMSGRQGDLTKSEPALLELEGEIERLKPVLEGFAKGGSK